MAYSQYLTLLVNFLLQLGLALVCFRAADCAVGNGFGTGSLGIQKSTCSGMGVDALSALVDIRGVFKCDDCDFELIG